MRRVDLATRLAALEAALDPLVHGGIVAIDDCQCPICTDPERGAARYRVLGALRDGVLVPIVHMPDNERG